MAALCMPHSASEQKLSAPVHSRLLCDFERTLGCAEQGHRVILEDIHKIVQKVLTEVGFEPTPTNGLRISEYNS